MEFYVNANAKFKDWKYSHIFVVDGQFCSDDDVKINDAVAGVRVYRDTVGTHYLLSSTDRPSMVDVSEPSSDAQGLLSL